VSVSQIIVNQNEKQMCLHFLNRLKRYDLDTYLHSCRVAKISLWIGESIVFDETFNKQVYYAALLHDVGKIKVPYGILHKTNKLSSADWSIIRKHSQYGAELLNEYPSESITSDLINSVYYHHEHYNGNGYPNGLRGDDIPLPARVISVADALDAMLNPRPYRKTPLLYDEAIGELQIHAGTQFDPSIIIKMINCL